MRSSWQFLQSIVHTIHRRSSCANSQRHRSEERLAGVRDPLAFNDPTFVNDTIRREHSPPR